MAKIDLKSNEAWSVVRSPGWVRVDPWSGTGDADVEITAAENTADERVADIVFETAVKKMQASVSVCQKENTTLRFWGSVAGEEKIFPSGIYTESNSTFVPNNWDNTDCVNDMPARNGFSGPYIRFAPVAEGNGRLSVYCNFIHKNPEYHSLNLLLEYRSDGVLKGNMD